MGHGVLILHLIIFHQTKIVQSHGSYHDRKCIYDYYIYDVLFSYVTWRGNFNNTF